MRNRITLVVSAMLVIGLVAGLTTSAFAGAGDPGATAAKKKKKVCPPGTHKVVVKKKNGKRKRTCVADPVAPPTAPIAPVTPAPTTTLSITPSTFAYPATQHGGACPGVNCPTHAFTVTNTGSSASGVPVVSITEVLNPEIGGPPAFTQTGTNDCTAALAPGASCTVTVGFHPNSNAGDEHFSSVLHVATAGSDVTATLSGDAN
jgi:archaellum component FlaG (FlaF/FlaG flagellin family)